ncbi:MAG: hypothetical protein GC200_01820 [Tepidisphaera sp.]|nr:hypothetical protein [Tepidisphaera sp.]
MRLFTRKPIYRAFPELDAYSDERCQRFVRAANRDWTHRVLSWFTSAFVAFIALILLVLTAAEFGPAVHDGFRAIGLPEDVFVAALMLFILIPPTLAVFYMRDVFLQIRLENVLRAQATCHDCGYSLIGISVSNAGDVLCPECGFTITIDPELDELAKDQSGRKVFEPKEPSTRESLADHAG